MKPNRPVSPEQLDELSHLLGSRHNAWFSRLKKYGADGWVHPDIALCLAHQIVLHDEYCRTPVLNFFKRVFDLIFASTALVLLSPLIFLAAAAIKLNSPGPIFFQQLRIGHLGRPFWVLKFRTMFEGADKVRPINSPLSKVHNDPRSTPVGNLLRKFKLDELPQLWNVIKGEMSIVGPRPLPCDESLSTPHHWFLRFAVRPGLTGLWQATVPNTVSGDIKLGLDYEYALRRSFLFDLLLILKTFPLVARGEQPRPLPKAPEKAKKTA